MRKRVLTLFLIMVMAIQMLPVMEMGKALYDSQFTEEIAHSISLDTDEVDKADFQKTEYLPTKTFMNPVISLLASTEHTHYAVTIPHNPANDINVPPPNC